MAQAKESFGSDSDISSDSNNLDKSENDESPKPPTEHSGSEHESSDSKSDVHDATNLQCPDTPQADIASPNASSNSNSPSSASNSPSSASIESNTLQDNKPDDDIDDDDRLVVTEVTTNEEKTDLSDTNKASDASSDEDIGFRNKMPNVSDLFGEDISSSDSASEVATSPKKPLLSPEDEERQVFGELSGEELEPERGDLSDSEPRKPTDIKIDVEMPKLSMDLGNELYFLKMPNFLSVEKRPFDPTYYEEDIQEDEDEFVDEEGRSRLKLKVENTIRWRTVIDSNGEEKRESNARIVRWSDNTISLYLGNEVFDIHRMPMQGQCNHLFLHQGTGLVGQAVFRSKLTVRPHSTDSATHRKMTMTMADRSSKVQKIKILKPCEQDPESKKTELVKREEEKLKASIKREAQQRRIREKQQAKMITPNYLEDEEDDDEHAISLAAIKNIYTPGGPASHRRPQIYSDSEEEPEHIVTRIESDDEDDNKKRHRKKAAIVEDDD